MNKKYNGDDGFMTIICVVLGLTFLLGLGIIGNFLKDKELRDYTYDSAFLIKEMEELGIGRPSTYAKTMDTIKERDYVTLEEKKFVPTDTGIEITDKLQEFFSHLINVEYTANMETDLDKIAEGNQNHVKVLKL